MSNDEQGLIARSTLEDIADAVREKTGLSRSIGPDGMATAIRTIASGSTALTEAVKTALLDCFAHVTWIDQNGQQYYDILEAALQVKTVVSISAVFTQGSAIIYEGYSLNTLKQYLVVTATYDDISTSVVNTYTLSGTLEAGTSIITVTCSGKTTTFTVTVTADPLPNTYKRLEYIQRSTTVGANQAYNTTGLTLNGTDDVIIKIGVMCIQAPSSANGGYFLGCRQTTSNNTVGFGILVPQYGNAIGTFDGQTCYIEPEGSGSSIVNKKYDLTVTKTSTGMTVTDGTHSNSVAGTPRAMVGNLYAFALYPYTGSNLVNQIYGRIYYLNIVEGGVEKVNWIPCRRISDNKIGFYNSVNEDFKTSDYYTAGPEV